MRSAPPFQPLAVEGALLEERAAALTRVTELFEEAWREVRALRRRPAAGEEGDREACVRALRRLRYRRWCLEVQREAIGLLHHERIDELYPIPERDLDFRGTAGGAEGPPVDFEPPFPYPTHGPTGR